MGEVAFSANPDEELVSMGLGSCVGVALLDRERAVAGLAHVMLPVANAAYSAPAKFADRAVPTLLACIERLGAEREATIAVLAGGAQMFGGGGADPARAGGPGLDLGARNEAAVRAALADAGIPVLAAATGGGRGRTIRVRVGEAAVTVKEAGGVEHSLWRPGAPADDLVEIS